MGHLFPIAASTATSSWLEQTYLGNGESNERDDILLNVWHSEVRSKQVSINSRLCLSPLQDQDTTTLIAILCMCCLLEDDLVKVTSCLKASESPIGEMSVWIRANSFPKPEHCEASDDSVLWMCACVWAKLWVLLGHSASPVTRLGRELHNLFGMIAVLSEKWGPKYVSLECVTVAKLRNVYWWTCHWDPNESNIPHCLVCFISE